MKPAKPGDSIGDFFTTKVFNKLIQGGKQSAKPTPNFATNNPATVMASSATTIQTYEPVAIAGPSIPNENHGVLEYNEFYSFPHCTVNTSLTNHNLAVAQSPISPGQSGRCVVAGITWVKADVTDLTHKWLNAATGSLVSSESVGKARILVPPESTGVGYCLILLGMMPSETQTFLTAIQVTATKVQYKEREIYCHYADDESAWIDLPSVACPEIEEE